MEKVEIQIWLRVAFACKYITVKADEKLLNLPEQVGNLLHHMVTNPDKYR